MKKLTKTEFILKARQVHGWRYDYSKVEYVNSKIPVCIICPEHGEFKQSPNGHLNGQNCPECSKKRIADARIIGTEAFIKRAKKKHGDKYDYSKVKYEGIMVDVCIICPIHGEFSQRAQSHLNGHGCPECGKASGINKRSTSLKDFAIRAQKKHNGVYLYPNTIYINSYTHVKIECPIHGEFEQTPAAHLRGEGCPHCAGKLMTTDKFIIKANKIHKNKYDYTKTFYKKNNQAVKIICHEIDKNGKEHGEFLQMPHDHLDGCGCPMCKYEKIGKNFRYNNDDFIEKARHIHGQKFDYSKVNYIDCYTDVCIICQKHGDFWQKPVNHLSGSGCPQCNESRGERAVAKWLDEHQIKYERQYEVEPQQLVLFGRNKFKIDFYLPDYNTFIEFNGMQHYIRNKVWQTEQDFRVQQDRDERLREYCKEHKIRLIEIPYTKIGKVDKILKTFII